MDSTSSEEGAMTVSTGKQTSKSNLAVEIAQEDAKTGDAGESHHDKETNSGWEPSPNAVKYPGTEGGESHHNNGTNSGWDSSKNTVSHVSQWPGTNAGESHHDKETTSRWESSNSADGNVLDWPVPGAGGSRHDKEKNSGWESWKNVGSHVSKWLGTEADNTNTSKCPSGWSRWEPMPGNEDKGKDGNISDHSWGKGMHLGPHAWQQRSRSCSPNSRWGRSHRSRSRSPSHGFKHETDGWNDRSRSRRGSVAVPCRTFAAGRCKWGSGCRFLHHGARDYDDQRFDGRGSADSSRQEKGASPGHAIDKTFTDSHEKDKFSEGHSSHYDGHLEDHVSQRSNRSSGGCYNFLKGRCNRGSACKFSHDGASADGYDEWPLKGGKRERAYDRGDFDDSFGCDWSGARKNSDMPCKYFAEGHCRNGENCKFSHQCLEVVGPEQVSQDGKCSHDLSSRNQSWDGAKWSERADAQNIGISPQQRSNNDSAEVGPPKGQPWDGPKWSDKASDKCTSSSPQWRNKDDAGFDIPRSTFSDGADRPYHMDREESRRRPRDPRFQNPEVGKKHHISPVIIPELILPTYTQNATPEVSVQQHVSTSAMKPVTCETPHVQQHPGQSERRQQLYPPPVLQSLNRSAHDQQMGLPTANVQGLNPNSQNQQGVLPVGNGQNFNPNGISQQVILPPSSVQKYTPEDVNMSPVTSEMPISQSTASSEKVPCGTNFLASLVQKLGNGQRLPLSHASLNHVNATGAVPSVPCSRPTSLRPLAPTAGQFVQSNQASWSQKQYDPISDSIEPAKLDSSDWLLGFSLNSHKENISVCDGMGPAKLDINDQPPGFSLNSHEQNTAFEGSQTSVKHLAPAVNSDLNNGDHQSHGGNDHDNQELMNKDIMAKKVDEKTMSQNEKELQTSHGENMDVDGQAYEERKGSKDEKGMRMFKFALVEFVKELLKPSWKEGHFSRDVHKTIVKKVVDKVIGSIQGPNIPQTQEKIGHYLSHSKTKLMKLVQAYVDKYSKT